MPSIDYFECEDCGFRWKDQGPLMFCLNDDGEIEEYILVQEAYDLDKLKGLINLASYLYDDFDLEERISSFVMHIGMTCNCLKNKPWKQSNMITDKEAFYKSLGATWLSYISILIS